MARAKAEAEAKGLEILWSPINQAWIILTKDIEPKRVKLLGVKNTVEDLFAYVDDY